MKSAAIFMCDKSGIMARPWAEAGYICFCVDIEHSIRATRKKGYAKIEKLEGGGMIYYVYGDARSWKPSMFDKEFFQKYRICFVCCFPVCTNLAGSGAQDWKLKGLAMLTDGLMLFNSCEQVADWSGAPYCIENPVGAITKHHRKPDYIFHPWFYKDLYQKKTCLWVGNGFVMPKADYVKKPEGVTQKIWLESPGDKRQEIRSETPEGFARAVFSANSYPDKQVKAGLADMKDHFARSRGYPNWDEMYNWICREGERPDVVAQLIESATEEACFMLKFLSPNTPRVNELK